MADATCPCGGPGAYADCCEPLHDRVREAETAEQLMRSRYSAYAMGRDDHVFRTWHPRTRPADLAETGLDRSTRWIGLRVVEVVDGGPGDDEGIVCFEADWIAGGTTSTMRERSRFGRRAGRWVYVAAVD